MKNLITVILLFATTLSYGAKIETLVSKEEVIWGFDFFKDGSIIYTERTGGVFTFDPATKKSTTIKGFPKVYAVGQGGLLDVRVHPTNGFVYFTYAEPLGKKSTTTLARAKVKGDELVEFKKLFEAQKHSANDYHYGSRIEFDKEGRVFLTVGERGERKMIWELDNHLGKVIRLNADGTVPNDNPYVNDKKAKPEIWAIGIRSPQGLAFKPGTDELWEAEMGPLGGDEINLIKKRANYGWPKVTYGREYYGMRIGVKEKEGTEQPLVYWVPSISPSAIAFYTGDKIPAWKGNLFIATLSGTHLRRLEIDGFKITKQEELFSDLGYRFRNVRNGPDGYLYISTDEGKLGKVIP